MLDTMLGLNSIWKNENSFYAFHAVSGKQTQNELYNVQLRKTELFFSYLNSACKDYVLLSNTSVQSFTCCPINIYESGDELSVFFFNQTKLLDFYTNKLWLRLTLKELCHFKKFSRRYMELCEKDLKSRIIQAFQKFVYGKREYLF